jgi:hypothetical protein
MTRAQQIADLSHQANIFRLAGSHVQADLRILRIKALAEQEK